jgi:hypothetical protein
MAGMALLPNSQVHQRYRVLILARSYKPGGWCVAGKIMGSRQHGQWVRLVGSDTTEGISADRLRINHSSELASPLDLIDLSLAMHRPYLYQHENFELGTDAVQRVSHLCAEDALVLADQTQYFWRSKYLCKTDRLPLSDALQEQHSLLLIRCRQVRICPVDSSLRKFRAQFAYQGVAYDLAITDPRVAQIAAGMPGGRMIPDALLTLSLSVPFHNYCYKLVASLIPVNA